MDARLKSLLVLGKEHYERHEFDRAEQAFLELLAAAGDRFADVHNMLAFILHDRGDLEGAEQHFRRAIEINPRYIEAHLNLAVTYSDLGKYEEAHLIYARIRKLEGDDKSLDPFVRGKIANMHADVAQAYADAGSRTEAIAELRKAVELCPTFADLHVKLGNLYRDGGDLPMASEHYATACTVNPRYVPARVLLGVTLLAMGQLEQATAEWRAALSIDPEHKSAQMYLRMAEAQRAAKGLGSPKADGAAQGAEAGQPDADANAGAPMPAHSVRQPPAVTQRSAMIPPAQMEPTAAPTPAPPSATPVPYSVDIMLDDDPDDEPTVMIDRNAEEPGTAS